LRIEWQPNHASRAFSVQTRRSASEKWINAATVRENADQQNVIQLPPELYSSIRIYQRGADGSSLRPQLMWISAVTLTN
jgi:hypothetical protein